MQLRITTILIDERYTSFFLTRWDTWLFLNYLYLLYNIGLFVCLYRTHLSRQLKGKTRR